jgi:hypothetical protein
VTVTPAGEVGIGTTPSAKLDVDGDIKSTMLDVDGDINTSSHYEIDGDTVLSVYGTENTFVGVAAGKANTTGQENAFLGWNAGTSNETGSYNTFLGSSAGQSITSGSSNVILGRRAGFNCDTGSSNIFIGNSAGYAETGSNRLHIDNFATTDPLIYGEFDNNIVTVHGFLGIETKEPEQHLHVLGDAIIGGSEGDWDGGSEFLKIMGRSDTWFVGAKNTVDSTDADFSIYPGSGAEGVFQIEPSGDVGIGTTSPSSRLHVVRDANSWAYVGHSSYGVHGYSGTGFAISGQTSSGYAGYFNGDVHVTGTLTKGGGMFVIDHPLDPENKLLRHNFVESPENLLIYRGRVMLDSNGEAVVQMPDYFEALAKEDEATVSLTSVGRPFLTGYEWRSDLRSFTVYGEPHREVAWMALADRDDPVIHEIGGPVEEWKGPDNKLCDRGELLYPIAYGYPKSMGANSNLTESTGR